LSRTFFAYHLTHHFGPFSLHSYHTNNTTVREGDQVYVVSGDDASDGGKDYSLEGLFRIHRRLDGPFELMNLKGQPATFQFRLSMTAIRVPDAPVPLQGAPWYDRQEVHRFFSSGQNFNPLPTEPDYKERFDALLAGYGQSSASELVDDLAEIERTVPDATERAALTQARIGQGRFRADVTRLWGRGEVCALTAIALPELLIASHIRPWGLVERRTARPRQWPAARHTCRQAVRPALAQFRSAARRAAQRDRAKRPRRCGPTRPDARHAPAGSTSSPQRGAAA